ncbi:MAG TPA: hypothetical protein VMV40_04175 [Acidiferrobacter sp.]|nr:hypothetical protein [Acidiferrobacter sp.]
MKRTGLFIIFFFVCAVPAMAGPKTVADYIQLAHQKEGTFFDSDHYRDLEQAIEIYDAIIKQYPKEFPEVYLYRAEDLVTAGYEKRAIKDFSKALTLDSANPKGPYLRHGVIYEERGEAEESTYSYKAAAADFTRALASRPTDRKLLGERARVRMERGDCGGAISDYSSAIEQATPGEPASSLDYEGRAVARICTGDLPLALGDYRTAIRADKALDAHAHQHFIISGELNKWALLRYMGRKSDADQELSAELVAAGTPTGIDSEYDAARYFLGQVKEAVLFGDADALKKRQPEYAGSFESDAWYRVGLKQVADGHRAAALRDFRKVLAIHQHTMGVVESTQAWMRELNRKPH